ncbi:MAG: replication-associated recombination protein A [Planctomycetes bacterium]|nr:replication-associated recombination protein A [Planctomycetota bacterium]
MRDDPFDQSGDVRPPLAERMRPQSLDEIVGQDHAFGPGTALRRLIDEDRLPSLILWGPPGVGKTTLARVLAGTTGATFESLSAVLSGVKEVREVVERARERRKDGVRTLLFVDEIHRFNRAQQDAFLPHVESGTVTLVGATTENPSFHVNGPLLSRSRVVTLRALEPEALGSIADRAVADRERGLAGRGIVMSPEARSALVELCCGDARYLLNSLESAAASVNDGATLTRQDVVDAAGRRALLHDKSGDEHFNLLSALQKSIRSGDVQAGLYWCVRLMEAGEDELVIARRLVVIASEDVGMAQPAVLPIVLAARDAVEFLGHPEGGYALLEAVAVLASAPRSNSLGVAWRAIQEDIKTHGALPVPPQLRNAPTKLMKAEGWGAGYQYAHDQPGGLVTHECVPPELVGREWYVPRDAGREADIAKHLERVKEHRRAARAAAEKGAPR